MALEQALELMFICLLLYRGLDYVREAAYFCTSLGRDIRMSAVPEVGFLTAQELSCLLATDMR